MKRKLLFIIFSITTLTLSACGKKETPVMSNSIETEVETEEETEPIVENEPITESETETITTTTEEIAETTTETDTTIEVDINGVDGAVEEGDYDEELHVAPETTTESEGTSSALDNITPEQRESLENLIDDLLETRGITLDDNGQQHIPADPAAEAALGVTYGTTESTDPDYQFGQGDYSGLEGGSLE